MSQSEVIPCSVLTRQVSEPLLLRSSSSPKSSLCFCGAAFHNKLSVEIIPYDLFTCNPNQLYSWIQRFSDCLRVKLRPAYSLIPEIPVLDPSSTLFTEEWWDILFKHNQTSSFVRMLRALISCEEMFSGQGLNDQRLCYLSEFCSPANCRSGCPCNGLQLRVGRASFVRSENSHTTPVYVWGPCSSLFAIHLVMSWAELSMLESETPTSLCPPSFGVLENWVDLLILGKLSPLATNSVQIEPEAPSFFDEPSCPIDPELCDRKSDVVIKEEVVQKDNGDTDFDRSTSKRQVITIVIRIASENATSALPSFSCWPKLSNAWKLAVQKRINEQPSTFVIDVGHNADFNSFDEIVAQVLEAKSNFCVRDDSS